MSKKNQRVNGINKSPRACAIELLIRCNAGSFANDLVPSYLRMSTFESRDRASITHIVYSTLRQQIRIDSALAKLSNRKLKDLDPIALNGLRSVVSQIVDGGDAHGVVNDVVSAMPFALKGFVNAISRKVVKAFGGNELFVDEAPNIKFSLAKWIYEEISETFSNPHLVAESLNASSSVTLANVSGGKLNIDNSISGSIVPESALIKSMGDISELEEFVRGEVIAIDQGSQLVTKCVDTNSKLSVLDVCAAPGGKSFLLASISKYVVSGDLTMSRMKKLLETKSRIRADNVFPIVSDATAIALSSQIGFDRILVDAPCSGLGVLRRRPDARLRIQTTDVDNLVELQKQILVSAIELLKPGAKLIYSVCTFTNRETLGIDEWLQEKHPQLIAESLVDVNENLVTHGRGALLAPTEQNDGMFALRLKQA